LPNLIDGLPLLTWAFFFYEPLLVKGLTLFGVFSWGFYLVWDILGGEWVCFSTGKEGLEWVGFCSGTEGFEVFVSLVGFWVIFFNFYPEVLPIVFDLFGWGVADFVLTGTDLGLVLWGGVLLLTTTFLGGGFGFMFDFTYLGDLIG